MKMHYLIIIGLQSTVIVMISKGDAIRRQIDLTATAEQSTAQLQLQIDQR